jgi:hypothetical protein
MAAVADFFRWNEKRAALRRVLLAIHNGVELGRFCTGPRR